MYSFMVLFGIWIIIITILVVVAAFGISVLARHNFWFIKIAKDTTVFVDVGDNMNAVMPNIEKFCLSKDTDQEGRRWLIPEPDEDKVLGTFFEGCMPGTVWLQKLLWKQLGVRFIGWVWTNTKRHMINIRSRNRLEQGKDIKEGGPLKSRIVKSHPETGGTVVDSLLHIVPRPVYVHGIKLGGDNSQINILLLPIFQQIIPVLPVYKYAGDFFSQLDAAIESYVLDFFATHKVSVHKDKKEKDGGAVFAGDYEISSNDKYESSYLTYAHWLKLSKAGGNSPLEKHLRTLNVSKSYRDKLNDLNEGTKKTKELVNFIDQLTHNELISADMTQTEIEISERRDKIGEKIAHGIIDRFGFAMVSFRIIDWEPHEETEDLAKALLAKETQFHQAEGVKQEALGRGQAIRTVAEAESNRYERLVNALTDKGVTPDVAAQVVLTQIRTENLGRGEKITTYVEGGANTSLLIK